jgi:hypothetical protein
LARTAENPLVNHAGAMRAVVCLAVPLCACAPLITADSPKNVKGKEIAPYEWHEECLHMKAGDRVEYAYESTRPVDFNLHYREGAAVIMPVVKDKSVADAGVFKTPNAEDYCLMWEAGVEGAIIDYRIRLRPATP